MSWIDIKIIENGIHMKEAFGGFEILNDIDPIDHPAVYDFAKIIFNYLKMSEAHERIKKEKS